MSKCCTEHFSRAANGGIGAASCRLWCSILPNYLANKEGFQQVIWTDDTTPNLKRREL
jgi:branched-chain amino acid aminotransferase